MKTVGSYGFSDDYTIIRDFKDLSLSDSLNYSMAQGRPILGLLLKVQYNIIDDFSDFKTAHLISVFFISLLTFWINRLLLSLDLYRRITKLPIIGSIVTVTLLLSLPSFQTAALWYVFLGPILMCLFSVIGIVFFCRKNSVPSAVFCSLVLIMSLFTYQITFALSVFLLAISISWSGSLDTSSRATRLNLGVLGFFISSGLLAQIVLITMTSSSPKSRGGFVVNFEEKSVWVIKELVPGIYRYRPWVKPGIHELTILITLTLFAVIWIIKKVPTTFKRIVFVLGLIFSFVPNLISNENWASNRSLISGQFAINLILLLFVISNSLRFIRIKIAVSALSILALVVSYVQIESVAVESWKNTQEQELKLISNYISKKSNCSKTKFVIPSTWDSLRPERVSYDEFGIPSTFPTWATIPYLEFTCHQFDSTLNPLVSISSRENTVGLEDKTLNLVEVLGNN